VLGPSEPIISLSRRPSSAHALKRLFALQIFPFLFEQNHQIMEDKSFPALSHGAAQIAVRFRSRRAICENDSAEIKRPKAMEPGMVALG
jgi:hypothetical protein